MLIRKKYWKWDPEYNDDKFNLGDQVTLKELTEELSFNCDKNEDGLTTYTIDGSPNVYLMLDDNNRIVIKKFMRDSMMFKYKVRIESQRVIELELDDLFEKCEKSDDCVKLVAVFGNFLLGALILTSD